MSKLFIATAAYAFASIAQAHSWHYQHHHGPGHFAPPVYVQPQLIYEAPPPVYYAPPPPQSFRWRPVGPPYRDMYGNWRRDMVRINICSRWQY